MKNRLPDPSEICAVEFEGQFRRFGICSVSGTMGNDRSIFDIGHAKPPSARGWKVPSVPVARFMS